MSPDPLGFHLVNFVLHLIVGGLVATLLWELGLSPGAVGIGAAAFLFHATAIETVAYATQRSELIAALGVLAACVLVAGGISAWRLLAACLAVVVGLAGKESAVIGFALIPLVAGYWRAAAGTALLIAGVVAKVAADRLEPTSLDWILTQLTAAWRLTLQVIPIGHTVDFDYDGFGLEAKLLAACLVLAGIGLAWYRAPEWGVASLGVFWIAIAVLPRLCFFTVGSPLNEHQFYLPLVGVAISAAGMWDYKAAS
jgi:hypothetical protein